MEFEEAWELAKLAPIHMSENEARAIYDLASGMVSPFTVEIGSAQGGSATILLAAGARVVCIDPMPPSLMIKPTSNMRKRCEALGYDYRHPHKLFLAQLRRLSQEGMNSIHHIRSADKDVKPVTCHILHVDHDHQYTTTKKTIERWVPHVRDYVLFHDYGDTRYPGVKRAVDESDLLSVLSVVECLAICLPNAQ